MSIQQTGLQFVARDLGAFLNATNSAARAVGQFVKSAGESTSKLNVMRGVMQNFASDLAYVARHLLYDAFSKVLDIFRDTVVMGGKQVIMYDQLSKSLTALAARDMLRAGTAKSMAEAMRLAEPIAKEAIKWVEKLAILSPFESEDIKGVLQFAQAVGFTVDEAKILTLAITDWASATGQTSSVMHNIANALGDMLTKGKVQSEEMRQLTRNGIPAWDYLAKAIGVNVVKLREMVSDGLVPANVGIKAIIDGLNKDFGGAAARFSTTLAGLISSVSDLTKIGLREFFTGSFQAIQPYLERFVVMMQDEKTLNAIRHWGEELGKLVGRGAAFAEAMFASGDPLAFIAVAIDRSLPGFYKLFEQTDKLIATFGEIVSKAFGWGSGIGDGIVKGLMAAASKVLAAVQSIADAINGRMSSRATSPTSQQGGRTGTPGGGAPSAPPGGGADTSNAPLAAGTVGLSTQPLQDMAKAMDEVGAKAEVVRIKWEMLRLMFEHAKLSVGQITEVVGPLKDIMGGLGIALGTVATSGLVGMAVSAFKLITPLGILTGLGTALFKAWQSDFGGIRELVGGALGDIGKGFEDLVNTVQNQTIPSIRQQLPSALESLKNSASGVAETIRTSWNNDIMPAIKDVDVFFNTHVAPTLAELAKGVMPLVKTAAETAAAVFTNMLVPAGKLVWDIFKSLVWPIIEEGARIFTNTLVPAITATVGFINQNFLPVLHTIIDVVDKYLLPILSALEKIIGEVLRLAFEALVAIWNSVVIPGLNKLWQEVKPVIDILSGPGGFEGAVDRVQKGWQVAVDWFNKATGGIEGIKSAVQGVIGWLENLADTLSKISIPSELIPHSPPPLAQGLTLIGKAAKDADDEFRGVRDSIDHVGGSLFEYGQKLSETFKTITEGMQALLREFLEGNAKQFDPEINRLASKLDPITDALNGSSGLEGAFKDTDDAIGDSSNSVSDLTSGMVEIGRAARELIGIIDDLGDSFRALDIPSELIPHSPPPLAQGVLSIAEAFKLLMEAMAKAPNVFGSLTLLTEQMAKDLADAQKSAADALEKIQQGFLKGNINVLDQMRENLRTIFDLRKMAESINSPGNEESKALDTQLKRAEERKRIAEAKNDTADVAKAVADIEEIQRRKEELNQKAQAAAEIANRSEAQMEQARQEALKNDNSEDAAELFQMRSKHIKDLADIDLAILNAKDDKEKELLVSQRALLVKQQEFEIELFKRQAQERTNELEKRIKAIADMWEKVFSQLDIMGEFPKELQEFLRILAQLQGLELPDWLKPGSPTPLELGLMGISRAMRQLSMTELPRLETGVGRISSPASGGQILSRGASSVQTVYAPNFNLGVTTNNSPGIVFQSFDIMRSFYGSY